jgi:hypothetical protein
MLRGSLLSDAARYGLGRCGLPPSWLGRCSIAVYGLTLCGLTACGSTTKADEADSVGAGGSATDCAEVQGESGGGEGLGGCDPADPDLDEDVISASEWPSADCEAFAQVACERLLECKPLHPSHHDGSSELTWERCLETQLAFCEPLNLPGSLLDDAHLAECSSRLESGSCALVRGSLASQGMYGCADTGTLVEGEACERFHQCASGRCEEGVCRGAPLDGPLRQLALDRGETSDGSSCHNLFLTAVDGICEVAGSDEGGACPCNRLDGLVCLSGGAPCGYEGSPTCPAAPDAVCGPPPELALGATCGHFGESFPAPGWCEEGTVCFEFGSGACVSAGAVGEPCESTTDSSTCGRELSCGPRPEGEVLWTGTCTTASTSGE